MTLWVVPLTLFSVFKQSGHFCLLFWYLLLLRLCQSRCVGRFERTRKELSVTGSLKEILPFSNIFVGIKKLLLNSYHLFSQIPQDVIISFVTFISFISVDLPWITFSQNSNTRAVSSFDQLCTSQSIVHIQMVVTKRVSEQLSRTC